MRSRPAWMLLLVLALAACGDGWTSHFTATDAAYRTHRVEIAPQVFLDAKPARPVRVVGYFLLTSPDANYTLTDKAFVAKAAATGRDLGCEAVVVDDLLQSSIVAPDNDLLACGNCGQPGETPAPHTPPKTKKFYCCLY